MRNIIIIILLSIFIPKLSATNYCVDSQRGDDKNKSFLPGQLWKDNSNTHINAHGGGILYHEGRYYWFGEHKGYETNNAMVGVPCYSSSDLYNWRNEGVVLHVLHDDKSPIVEGCVIERPKVIFNKETAKFVMYFHLEMKDHGYDMAHVGIAVSDNVTGPFKFIRSYRPNAGFWPLNMTKDQQTLKEKPEEFKDWRAPEWQEAVNNGLFVRRDFQGGQMSRDMTLFVDDDGKAFHIYASEENQTLQLAELSDDYLSHTGKYIRIAPGGHNEAPAIFKKGERYFMITSGCTGWEPNTARLLAANNIWGPWESYPNPCVGKDADLTFYSQSTYIFPVAGKKDAFIFMADRWTPKRPIDGRYIWLPITFENDLPVLKWEDEWTMEDKFVDLLDEIKESYTLSGHTLAALSEKILYKKTEQENLYLYLLRPQKKTTELLPAIVYFTGGGWINGDVYGQIPNAAWFRDRGIIGIEADYRVESRHGTSPLVCIEDGKSAIRYIRENAKELGVDPDRIIVAGGSAGGHIAICTFLDGGDAKGENLSINTKPNALILHNPVLGKGFGEVFFVAHPEFSPILQVKNGWPPTILSNGTKDSVTPYSVAEKFTDQMKEAGNECELITVDGAEHSCDWPVSNPNFLLNMEKMYLFLKIKKIIK